MNTRRSHASAPGNSTTSTSPAPTLPVLTGAEASRRRLLLAELQTSLASLGIRCVLARNHRLVLRYNCVPCETSGPTDPQLHIFALDGTDIATTDGRMYNLASGEQYPTDDPAATAALIRQARRTGAQTAQP